MSYLKSYLPAILWLLITTVLSCLPGKDLPNIPMTSFDKLAHATFYAVFAFLIYWGIRKSSTIKKRIAVILSFFISSFYGLFMEWVQGTFFPYRTMDMKDALANATGALIVCIFILMLKDTKNPNNYGFYN